MYITWRSTTCFSFHFWHLIFLMLKLKWSSLIVFCVCNQILFTLIPLLTVSQISEFLISIFLNLTFSTFEHNLNQGTWFFCWSHFWAKFRLDAACDYAWVRSFQNDAILCLATTKKVRTKFEKETKTPKSFSSRPKFGSNLTKLRKVRWTFGQRTITIYI